MTLMYKKIPPEVKKLSSLTILIRFERSPKVPWVHGCCGKAAGPIEMVNGGQICVSTRNHILDGDPNPSREWALVGGMAAHCNIPMH